MYSDIRIGPPAVLRLSTVNYYNTPMYILDFRVDEYARPPESTSESVTITISDTRIHDKYNSKCLKSNIKKYLADIIAPTTVDGRYLRIKPKFGIQL